MALAVDPLKAVKIQDPRVDLDVTQKYLIEVGAGDNSFRPVSTSSVSNSSISFSAPPPNQNVVIDNKVYVRIQMDFVFTPTVPLDDGEYTLNIGSQDALRAFPFAQVCNSLSVNINNSTFTTNIKDYIEPLMRYNMDHEMFSYDLTGTPCMQDQYQDYRDGVNMARNPLGYYGANMTEQTRGGFIYTITANPPSQVGVNQFPVARVSVIITEPLFLSPFNFAKKNHKGFIGVQTMDVTFNLGDLTRAWSRSPAARAVNIEVQIPNNNVNALLFNYLTPQVNDVIPETNVYPYYSIDRFVTNLGDVNNNTGLAQRPMSNIQLNSIPKRLYIFARIRNADQTFNTSDAYARIDRISVNFNNRSGLLSSATSFDLWQMSVRNGLKMSYPQWYQYTGSVLCLDPSKDLSLSPLEANGLLGSFNLNFTIDIFNPSGTYAGSNGVSNGVAINYDLYCVVVSEGSFTIINGNSVPQIGVISEREVLSSPELHAENYYDMHEPMDYFGGNIFQKIKSAAKKIAPYAQKAIEVGKKAAPIGKLAVETFLPRFMPGLEAASPYVSKGAEFAEDLLEKIKASGYSEEEAQKVLMKMLKSAAKGGVYAGSGVVGGKAAPKRKLAARAKKGGMLEYY